MNPDNDLPWLLDSTPAAIREWIGDQQLLESLERELRDTIWTRTALDHGQAFMQSCPVAGASAADYCLREVALFPDASVLAGIHFYGCDVARPFVGVYAQSRSLTASETLEASARLCDAFAAFKPAWTWWWMVGGPDASSMPAALQDQRVLAGDLREIRRLPVPDAPTDLKLHRDCDASSYHAYLKIFERFIQSNPAGAGCVGKTDHDDYLECARAGAIHTVEVDGRLAGVIAARPGAVRGIPAWEMVDEILDEGYRGRGLAARMQRLFLDRLDIDVHPLVIGTINWANEPSRRTALRIGRQDVGGWIFVPGTTPNGCTDSAISRPEAAT